MDEVITYTRVRAGRKLTIQLRVEDLSDDARMDLDDLETKLASLSGKFLIETPNGIRDYAAGSALVPGDE